MSPLNVNNGYADGLSWKEAISLIMRKHEDLYTEGDEGEEIVVSSEEEEDTDEGSSLEESLDETDEEESDDETGEESEDESEGNSNIDNEKDNQADNSERNGSEQNSPKPTAIVPHNPRTGRHQSRTYGGTDRRYHAPPILQSGHRRRPLTVNARGAGRTQVDDVPLDNENVRTRDGLQYDQALPSKLTQTRPHFEGNGSLNGVQGSSLPRPVYGTHAWHESIRQAQTSRSQSTVSSSRTGTIQQVSFPHALAPRGPQIQHHFSTPRVPLRQTPGHLKHDQALRTHEIEAGQRPKRSRTVEDSGRNKAKSNSVTSTNKQKMDQVRVVGANYSSQSPDNARKTVQSPTPTMSRAQTFSPWSQKPPWPPGYFLAGSLKKPSPWAIYEQPVNSLNSEQPPSETSNAAMKRSSDAVEGEAQSPSSKRPRTVTSRPSTDIPSIGVRDSGNTNHYVGGRYRTPDGRPRRFSGEPLSEKELRGHITGYPPRDQPMPEGLSVEEKVRYWPNHLHGKLLLEITDGDWGLKPTEIARMFNGKRDENLLKPNTLVKRILKLREARDAGKEIL